MDISQLENEIIDIFLLGKEYEQITSELYKRFSYPKFPKLMKFETRHFKVKGYGYLFSMRTKGPFGMELLTLSFTPSEGGNVPFLLIDIMIVGKKRTVFVEYYDCTASGDSEHVALEEIKKKYDHLTEYAEKPHWYVGERTPYSLIKCGTNADEAELKDMITASVSGYAAECSTAELEPAKNLPGLAAFRRRMIEEGNPSSAVLEKVFGKEGAEEFFVNCVMAGLD